MVTSSGSGRVGELTGLTIGPYRLVEELGRGGMGVVYRGVRDDNELRMTVAVKLIHKSRSNPEMIARFRRERQILADLRHPNIAQLMDAGTTEDGLPYFVMEYVPGVNLTQWCQQIKPDLQACLQLFRKLLDAVAFAHRNQVIHRDIKPGNIVVGRDDQPKLLDFGIARSAGGAFSELTRGASPMTPQFAAPEQLLGQAVTARSDIYSLALLLLEMITGRRPRREHLKPLEVVRELMNAEPTLGRDTASSKDVLFPPGLGVILLEALADDPAERTTSCELFAQEIDRLIADLNQSASRSGRLPTKHQPFRGLEVFREQDRDFFFGREAISRRLFEHLQQHRFLAVLGPSGSGKSSVVQAGVIPLLRERRHLIALFTPHSNPLEEAAFALARLFNARDRPQYAETVLKRLEENPDALHFMGRELLIDNPEVRLYLVVDQFEELFTLSQQNKDRFVSTLLHTLEKPESPVSVILLMRSDFIGRCTQWPGLNQLLTENLIQIGPMQIEELRAAMEEPARLAGLEFEKGLVSQILDDVAGAPGELPLLEHALLELYHRRKGNLLTPAAYAEIGGIKGALARRAESEFGGLDERGQLTLRKMFTLCLVHPGEGAPDTRRRAHREELLAAGTDRETAATLLHRWMELRLLTGYRDETRNLDLVDVAHEALIRNWPRITTWMAEDREIARQLGRLRRQARSWDAAGRDPDQLLRGAPLVRMEELVQQEADHLGSVERDYVAAGVAERLELSRRQEATARRLRKRKNLAQVAGAAALLLAVVSFSLYLTARSAKQEADQEKAAAVEARLLAEREIKVGNYHRALTFDEKARNALEDNRPHEAWLYALAALASDIPEDKELLETKGLFCDPRMGEAGRLLWTSPVAPRAGKVALSPDGSLVAVADDMENIYLMSLETGARTAALYGHTAVINDLAFSPDGRMLASASSDRTLKLWDVTEGKLHASLNDSGKVTSVVFSQETGVLYTASAEGNIRAWSAEGLELDIWQSGKSEIHQLALSPDGSTLAAACGDHSIRVWDTAGGVIEKVLKGHKGPVRSVVFTGNRSLASASEDSVIHLWRLDRRDPLGSLLGHSNPVIDLAFSVDGSRLASVGEDHAVILWDLQNETPLADFCDRGNYLENVSDLDLSRDGRLMATVSGDESLRLRELPEGVVFAGFSGHSGRVNGVAFSRDGALIASASNDLTVRLWDRASGRQTAVLSGHNARVISTVFSPDGKTLASSSKDGTIRLWQTDSGAPSAALRGHTGAVISIAFSPDGRLIASGGVDKTIRLWSHEKAETLSVMTGHEELLLSLAFSPDGSYLASGSSDDTVRLWHVDSARQTTVLKGHSGAVTDVAFAPDGNLLVSASADKTIRLWDRISGKSLSLPAGHDAMINALAFSPDGKRLASASRDRTIRLWDLTEREEVLQLSGHSGEVTDLDFSGNGKYLVSGSEDNSIKLWEIAENQFPSVLQGHTGVVFSADFSPDGRQLATVSSDRTLKIWDIPSGRPQHTRPLIDYKPADVAFSPDGKNVAAALNNGAVGVWSVSPKEAMTVLQGHTEDVTAVAFSPTGDLLASASTDLSVRLWEMPSGKPREVLTGHGDWIWDLAFSPVGKQLASCDLGGMVRVWDLEAGVPPLSYNEHSDSVFGLTFTPDGSRLVSSSADRTLRLWDIETGRTQTVFSGHSGWVFRSSVSPDGKYLASSSMDRTIGLWDMETGRLLARLGGHSESLTSAVFSPRGSMLASASLDQTIRLWDIEGLLSIQKGELEKLTPNLLRRSLLHFGYRPEEIRLVPESPISLIGIDGYSFTEPAPLGFLAYPKPAGVTLIDWLKIR
ncbi:MAG: protein kinase [Acidobacteriota bacterium]|nr:protein kinase [Acidobacteriota bacterium]